MRFFEWLVKIAGNLYLLMFTIIFLICLIIWLRNFNGFSPISVAPGPNVVMESPKIQTNDILKIILGILCVMVVISFHAKFYFQIKYFKLRDYENFEGLSEVFGFNLSYYRWKASFYTLFPFLNRQDREELEVMRRKINFWFIILITSVLLIVMTIKYLEYRFDNNLR